ncbi:MAG: DUF3795 domain-containing protein [Candidatus Lokiarchaeota archaeon]|nr:DUF3795 domain-containing protein [Candidatus Lokiarchaeota archaeon]
MDDQKLIAPCGVYCGVCPYLIAHKHEDEELKKKLAKNIGVKPEKIECEGCRSNYPFFFCRSCTIKACVLEKKLESCALCDKFPCEKIENYPYQPFIENVKWDINCRRKLGKEAWIEKTIKINTCPACNTLNHRKAKRCIKCNEELPKRY